MNTTHPAQLQKTLVLASQSARRLELLRQLGVQPTCRPVDVDEQAQENETAQALVQRLAQLKAGVCAQQLLTTKADVAAPDYVIIGADTVIELDGSILGKPRDAAHCVQMLRSLSDRDHTVHTGVCVLQSCCGDVNTVVVSTQVGFAPVSSETAHRYWLTGEPADKAGAYAIQGLGAQFVVHLSGSYSNVVGLPLFETSVLLTQAGITSL